MTDPVSDFLIRVKNAYMARKTRVEIPHSKYKQALANVLSRYGFLGKIEVKNAKVGKNLLIDLLYQDKKPKITDIKIISKPGRRSYTGYKEIPRVYSGLGIALLSTPEGVISDKEARKKKLGGELICKIW
nr:30S ribosomal protein S8, small subunit ribosomal protein S8 [uncultured Microgenomates bacterium Rifle_16ft_4_minimus_22956]